MLEDSITSSPSKSNKSIKEARRIRKNKRKKEQSVQPESDHEQSVEVLHDLINEFYNDSENEHAEIVTKPPAIISNFKPFEIEKSLIMADHMQAQQYKPNVIPVADGFVECQNLPKAELKIEYCNNANEYNKEDSSCIITESELLNCCHQAEKILRSCTSNNINNAKLIFHQLTPNKNDQMNLVNSILEDFSQSPLGKEQIVTNTSWHTPEFRLRKQPAKTYSRTRKNLIQHLEMLAKNSSEHDDDQSSCSSLSIQEDVTVTEKLNSLPTIADNTPLLCENLLNLTEYFTQNQTHPSLSDEGQRDTNDIDLSTNGVDNLSNLQNIPDLIKDILSLHSTYPNKKRYDSYNSTESFYGFSNENKSSTLDAVNSDQETLIKDQNLTYDINVSNNRLLDESNKEDKSFLNDWPEDDFHDMFACINTENILQDFIAMPHNATENVEVHATHKPVANNDNFLVSTILNQSPGISNCIGFKTASSKPIKVSKEAHIMAAKILSKLPDIAAIKKNCDTKIIQKDFNPDEDSEDDEWNDDCDLFLNIQTPIVLKENTEIKPNHLPSPLKQIKDFPSTSKVATLGFKTAGGNNVHISVKAQQTAQQLLDAVDRDFSNDNDFEKELRELKMKSYEKTHNLQTKHSDSKPLNTNQGFQTANGKSITISTSAQKHVANILKELESKQNYDEKDLETMKEKFNKKNKEIMQSTSATNCTIKETYVAQFDISQPNSLNTNNNRGYNTTSDKMIDTHSKGMQSMHKILEEFNNNCIEDNLIDLKSLQSDIYRKNGEHKVKDNDTNQNNKVITKVALSKRPLENLCKAGTKEEFISSHCQNENKTLQEISAILNIKHHENGLEEIKTKVENKNKELKSKSNVGYTEYANVTINQCLSTTNNGNKLNLTPKLPINNKRKYSTDNSDSESLNKTPPVKFFKNSLCRSKSSLAEQSLKSPLASTAQTIVLKKNLLTLTKRRKSKRNILNVPVEEIPKVNNGMYELNVHADTPTKSNMLIKAAGQSPASPNLKEFFSNAPLTSTPRLKTNHNIPSVNEDVDLKPITWETNNDSISNKLPESMAINITLNSSNPTAQKRIDRLKMYGKAPALSPILIEANHNCRPSGLRRTRSMLKKIEK